MKKDKIIYKDFGKVTTDTENRDEKLRAYICAIFDVPDIQFDDIIKSVKNRCEKEAFIYMICNDIKGRAERFLK